MVESIVRRSQETFGRWRGICSWRVTPPKVTKGCQAQVHWIWNDGTAEAWVLISENVWTRDVGARSVEMPGEMDGRGTRGAEVESGSWHGEIQTTKRTPHHGVPATQTPQTVRENSRTTPRIGPNDSSPRHAAIAQRAQVQKVKLIPPIFGATGLDTQPPHFLAISSIPVPFSHLSTSTARRAIAPHHICCRQPLVIGNPNPPIPSIRDTF